ncbi:MAG: hypothetical protein LC749_01550, partial [Actinobacteria bacterium]|nr:hypothetical protein [Actinomycetota bacterium]
EPNTHKSSCSARAASPSPATDPERRFDETRHDPMEWIEGQVNLFGPGEEPLADAMLDHGDHPKKIVNTINKQREEAAWSW